MSYVQDLDTLSARYQELLHRERGSKQAQAEVYRAALSQLAARYQRLAPTTELPLTIPQIFGRGGDENFISNYLAFVLNPEFNGIGTAPLEKLLELIGLDDLDLPWDALTIDREVVLPEGRIDLLLVWEDSLVVGIENKIYSSEHGEQTLRYAKDISERFANIPVCLVYLSRGKQKPASKKFQSVSYTQLVDVFRTVPVSPEIGLRKYLLWEDFLEHLEVYIIMADPEKFEFSEKTLLYIEHHSMLKDLEAAFRADFGNLIVWLENRLRDHLEDSPEWKFNFSPSNYSYQQVYKHTWKSSKLYIHFEYLFTTENLVRKEVSLMVDAEMKDGNSFLELYDKHYPVLQAKYQELGIEYRPKKRRIALAWKTYPISNNFQEIAEVFITAFEEFRFLEPEIDQVIAEMSASKGHSNQPAEG